MWERECVCVCERERERERERVCVCMCPRARVPRCLRTYVCTNCMYIAFVHVPASTHPRFLVYTPITYTPFSFDPTDLVRHHAGRGGVAHHPNIQPLPGLHPSAGPAVQLARLCPGLQLSGRGPHEPCPQVLRVVVAASLGRHSSPQQGTRTGRPAQTHVHRETVSKICG